MASNPNVLSPPPVDKVRMLNGDGSLNPMWVEWFLALYRRVGKAVALTNAELQNIQLEEIGDVQTDLLALQSSISNIITVNTSQSAKILALEQAIEGLQLAPIA